MNDIKKSLRISLVNDRLNADYFGDDENGNPIINLKQEYEVTAKITARLFCEDFYEVEQMAYQIINELGL